MTYCMTNPVADSYMSKNYKLQTNLILETASKSLNPSSILFHLLNDFKNYEAADFRKKMFSWLFRPIIEWEEKDVLLWASCISMKAKFSLLDSNVSCFSQQQLTGKSLYNIKQSDFLVLHPNKEVVNILFDELQNIKNIQPHLFGNECRTEVSSDPLHDKPSTSANCSRKLQLPRPRNQPTRVRNSKIWHFIRDLLYNGEYNPAIICWENFETGTFRFVNTAEVARLWGVKKRKNNMTYEKFWRLIRHHYKKKVFIPHEKKFVYQFGPNAIGWKRSDSNSKTTELL